MARTLTLEERADRFRDDDRLDATLRRITPKLPMRGCRAVVEGRDVTLDDDGQFRGSMHLCRDAYCEFCARNIAWRRRLEVIKMVGEAFAFDQSVWFVTLTSRHKREDWLPDLLRQNQDALNHAFDVTQRSYRRLRDRFGVIGIKWSSERTWSRANGWHPHFHLLVFVNRQWTPSEAAEFRLALGARWIEGQRIAGGRKPTIAAGVRLDQVDNDLESILRVGGYMSKIGDGIATEMTGERTKGGRQKDSWTFWEKARAFTDAEFDLPPGERAFLYLPMPDKVWGIGTTVVQERDRSIWREGPREGRTVLLPEDSARLNAEISREVARLCSLRRQVPDDDDIEDWDAYDRLLRRIRYFEEDIEWMRSEYQCRVAESEWRRDADTGELFRVGELIRQQVFLPDREHLRELVEWMIHSGERAWGGSRAHPNPANADEERWNRILAASSLKGQTRESLEDYEAHLAYRLGFEDDDRPERSNGERPERSDLVENPPRECRVRYYIDGGSYMSLIFSNAELRSLLRVAAMTGPEAVAEFRARTGLLLDTAPERFAMHDRGLTAHLTGEMLQAEPYLEPWMLSIPDRRDRTAAEILRDADRDRERDRRSGRIDSTSYRGRAPRASSGPRRATARSDHSVDLSRRARNREWRRSLRELQAAYPGWTWSSSTDQRDPELSSATMRAV